MKQENNNVVESTTTSEKTFDEILEDKKYQSEYDRRLRQASDTAVTNARKKWEEEQKIKNAEAEKLAKMNEEQKISYEMEQITKRAIEAENKLNAHELKDEAVRQANERGIDLDLMLSLDYTKETAESIKKKIEVFEKVSKKTYEKAISEYSKELTPQVGNHISTSKSKDECKSYKDFVEYFENQKK